MPLSTRASTAIKLSIALLSLSITAFYLFVGSSDVSHHLDLKVIYQTAVKGKKTLFIEKFLADDNQIDGPFNSSMLIELCKTRDWTPGLIFKCEAPEGGIGNVRNVFLNCVRYAIEAGATSFIVPEILIRTTTAPEGKTFSFGHYFDLPHFSTTLQSICPQIHLVSHQDDLYNFPSTATPIPLIPNNITNSLHGGSILAAPGNWSESFQSFLNKTHPVPPTEQKPILVSLAAPLFQFPLAYDNPHLVAQFGRILRFREDVRRIAAATLYALSTKHNLGLEPARDVPQEKFYGAHLRTGRDAAAAGWTPYAVQERNYIAHAIESKLSLIYLTPTIPEDVETFTHTAANASISVETKDTLLASKSSLESSSIYTPLEGFEDEWESLQYLSWDQQLLVDFEVLLRSSIFGGMWRSSFSWNVAMRRHVVASGANGWTSIAPRGTVVDELPSKGQVRRDEDAWVGDGIQARKAKRKAKEVEAEDGKSVDSLAEAESPQAADPEVRSEPKPEPSSRPSRPSISAPPASHPKFSSSNPATLSATEMELASRLEAEQVAAGPPASVKEASEGEASFRDRLSVVFGPVGDGARVKESLWP